MGRKARMSKGKTMKPNFFVFCEGETEVAYVKFLRSIYRVPIQIIPKKSDSNITNKYIENYKRDYVLTKSDKTFLMFDLDVDGMLERLQKVSGVTLLVSNPCIEFWFLLHYEDCRLELSSVACMQRLKRHSATYGKGNLSQEEKLNLQSNSTLAMERAKNLIHYECPSSTIYLLIDEIKGVSS